MKITLHQCFDFLIIPLNGVLKIYSELSLIKLTRVNRIIDVNKSIVPKIIEPNPIIDVLNRICRVSVNPCIVIIVKNIPIPKKINPGMP